MFVDLKKKTFGRKVQNTWNLFSKQTGWVVFTVRLGEFAQTQKHHFVLSTCETEAPPFSLATKRVKEHSVIEWEINLLHVRNCDNIWTCKLTSSWTVLKTMNMWNKAKAMTGGVDLASLGNIPLMPGLRNSLYSHIKANMFPDCRTNTKCCGFIFWWFLFFLCLSLAFSVACF